MAKFCSRCLKCNNTPAAGLQVAKSFVTPYAAKPWGQSPEILVPPGSRALTNPYLPRSSRPTPRVGPPTHNTCQPQTANSKWGRRAQPPTLARLTFPSIFPLVGSNAIWWETCVNSLPSPHHLGGTRLNFEGQIVPTFHLIFVTLSWLIDQLSKSQINSKTMNGNDCFLTDKSAVHQKDYKYSKRKI